MSDESTAYTGWAVVELMGHRRIAGHVSEAAQYGTSMIRIDVPAAEPGGQPITQFYGGSSIYCLSPVTEDVARAVALRNRPAPVSPYEILPPRTQTSLAIDPELDESYDDGQDDDEDYR
jgi:hypothetical protein